MASSGPLSFDRWRSHKAARRADRYGESGCWRTPTAYLPISSRRGHLDPRKCSAGTRGFPEVRSTHKFSVISCVTAQRSQLAFELVDFLVSGFAEEKSRNLKSRLGFSHGLCDYWR